MIRIEPAEAYAPPSSAHDNDARCRSIIESAMESFVSIDTGGIIRDWNRKAEETFGWTRAEAIGRDLVSTLIPPRYRESHLRGFERYLRTGEGPVLNRRIELAALHKDGCEIPVEITISALHQNGAVSFNAFLHDITERRAAAEALERAHDELEDKVAERTLELAKANRDLETLLHVITHDLKEPLRAMESFARIIRDRHDAQIDDRGRDYLRRIMRGAERLRRLLDDLTTLVHIPKAMTPSESVPLDELVREAILRLDAKVRETSARIEIQGALPTAPVERTWATQAIYNMIDNALKFTRASVPPDVEISAFREDGLAGLVIADRGPGVPPGTEERIFELFQRGVGREIDGTGAGLAIVRHVADRHHGRAFVRSRQGGGSEFVIAFMAEASHDA